MTSDHETGDSRRSNASSHDAHGPVTAEKPVHDDAPASPDAHLGAVDSETSAVVPPMHESSDQDDQIDPADEITPG